VVHVGWNVATQQVVYFTCKWSAITFSSYKWVATKKNDNFYLMIRAGRELQLGRNCDFFSCKWIATEYFPLPVNYN
jgi:hypothetical protein